MGKVYDDWGRLVEAVVRREKLRQLCLQHSRSPSDTSSDCSFILDLDSPSSLQVNPIHSPLYNAYNSLFIMLDPQLAVFKFPYEYLGCLNLKLYRDAQCTICSKLLLNFEFFSVEKQTLHIMQMAMVRLEEVLIHNLSKMLHDEPMHKAPQQGSSGEADERVLDLQLPHPMISQMALVDFDLPADMIPQLKSVVDAMFASCHGQDFCQALIRSTRVAFGKFLAMLNVPELCFGNIHDMTWHGLRSSINKWRIMIKIFIGNYLCSVKVAFDQILGEHGQTSLASFIESSQESVMSLLDIGEVIVIKPHEDKLDALYVFLRAYRDVACLSPNMDALFPDEIGSIVRKKFYDLLTTLKKSVKVIFKELHSLFQSCHVPLIPDGSIHPFTRFVINHILCLLEHHADTFNLLVEEGGEKNLDVMSNVEIGQNPGCPLAAHVQSVTAVLEARLDISSNSYKDQSWKHLFMMNNIHYIMQKVSHSATRGYFPEEWIRMLIGKVRWHAMYYQRLTWNHAVSLLRDDDSITRSNTRARGHAFTTAFDDVYRSQRRLHVPSVKLREELRILALQTVVYAYNGFLRRYSCFIDRNHFKYTVQDLENYIMDGLLDGSSKSVADSTKSVADSTKWGNCFTLKRSK